MELSTTWVADFETTTTLEETRVWAWGAASLEHPNRVAIADDIDSFFDFISDVSRVVYFHNLKFDGSFIVDFLFRRGFKHTTDSHSVRIGQFATLISEANQWYSITVRMESGALIEFRDSLKKLPMKVAVLAKAFELPFGKGDLDYTLHRPVGWVITDDERDYIARDVRIVAHAMRTVIEEGATKLTVGADSLAEFKNVITPKAFERLFPVLSLEIDADLRKAYRGGWTYASDRYKRKVLGKGRVFDVNSLYPSVMYNKKLPHGEPTRLTEMPDIDDGGLYILDLEISGTLKPKHVPCIQIKNSGRFGATEYIEEIGDEPVRISCTNVDLRLWLDHYDLEYTFISGWSFKGAKGMFTQFIDKWSKIKAENEGGLRALAKLHLNSLYGKFATNPDVTQRVPVMDPKKNALRLIKGKPETRDPVYTAMGVFITAYARDITIRAAQAHYDEFVYADTDSLHLVGEGLPPGLDVHKSRLGAWKHEYDFAAAVFSRAKCYTELAIHKRKRVQVTRRFVDWSGFDDTYREYETHIAGMPSDLASTVRFKHHLNGHEFGPKLRPVYVPGGTVLVDTTFKLNM